MTKQSDISNTIVLKSVRGKVDLVVTTNPAPDPVTGQFPDCVKPVDSNNNMILSEKELLDPNRRYWIRETDTFELRNGKTFNLDDTRQRFEWEAVKHCPLIAPDYYSKDSEGKSLINGDAKRYGVAELYVVRPGVESNRRVSKRKLKHDAETYIYNDERGNDGRVLMARLLGHKMSGMPDADVTEFLLNIADNDPQKIIDLYTGGDTSIRLLFIEARDKHIINYKNRVYYYADNIVLGATDDAVILFLKDPKNANILKLIKQDTYPDLITKETKA